MPTGFETRQPGRNSFASPGTNPVQVSPSARGTSAGAQIVGGQATGGVVSGEAAAPAMGASLGSFFGRIMEPHVIARQKEEFDRGVVEQMSRQAGDEIHASNGGFSKIFGQTGYVQGAVAYTIQSKANQFAKDTDAESDTLAQMEPAELSKYVSAGIQKLSTGNDYEDAGIRGAVLEAIGPVVQTIAKKRYVQSQKNAVGQWSGNAGIQADLIQKTGVALADLTAPTGEDTAALAQAGNNFRAALIKPHGMDDETYIKSLPGFVKAAAQNGNGYAVTALVHSGVMSVLDDKDQVALEDSIQKYGRQAIAKLALDDPEVSKRIHMLQIHQFVEAGRSPSQIEDEARQLNDYVKRRTGFDIDMLDAKEVSSYGKGVIDAIHAEDQKAKARNEALADRKQQREWDREDKAAEIAATTTAVNASYAQGGVRQALAAGVGNESMFNIVANNDFVQGRYDRLNTAYRASNWVSSLVQNVAQAKVSSALGAQYSPSVEAAHKEWLAVRAVNPALASAIYGKYDVQLTNFDKMVGSGLDHHTAYTSAFLNPAHYRSAQMPPERRKEAGALVSAVVNSEQPWTVLGYAPFQRTGLNASSKKLVGDALWDDFAVRSGNSSLPGNVIQGQVLEHAIRSGRLERYGAFAWRNETGTVPMGQLLGLQQDESDKVVTEAIDKGLKASGFSSGASGNNYEVQRIKDEHGNPALYVLAYDGHEADPIPTLISFKELKTAATALKQPKAAPAAVTHPSKYNNVDPYRYVKGESVVARLLRINREVDAGADPVKRRK